MLPASFAKVGAEIHGLFVMHSIVSSRFEVHSSDIIRPPLIKSTDMPSQVRVFVGFHSDDLQQIRPL